MESGHLADLERDDILTLLWIVGKYIERVGGSGVGRFFGARAINNNGYF